MERFISISDTMKKYIAIVIFKIISLTCYAQGTFNYCTMINNIWGEWQNSENPFDRYYITKVGNNEWITYRYCEHPSNYLFKIKINNFYFDNDKKSRKAHIKNNQWYEFTGSVEIFTDAETFARQYPFVASHDKPEIRSLIIPARIRIEPYKKKIKTINILFDEVGIGLGFW